MILAQVHPSSVYGRYYELTDFNTKQTKQWIPPHDMTQEQEQDALLEATERFEEEIMKSLLAPVVSGSSSAFTLSEFEVTDATTLQQYAQFVFMPRKTVKIAENTRDTWQRYLDLRINPRLGWKSIRKVTTANLEDFLLSCQAEGLSVSSVQKYYTLLNQIFKMAYKRQDITENPMAKVDRPTPRKDEIITNKLEAFDALEIARIEKCIENEPLKWQAIIHLLIDTGMRIGECCGLRWQLVDFQNKTVTIRANLCHTKAKGTYLSTPKNRRERTVSVGDDTMYLLLKMYAAHPQRTEGFIFTQKDGVSPMHPQSPAKYMRKLGIKKSIDHMHPHKFRHSYASIAITGGADIASVAENLGHTDKSVTLRMYTSANEESKRQASDICRQKVKDAAAEL